MTALSVLMRFPRYLLVPGEMAGHGTALWNHNSTKCPVQWWPVFVWPAGFAEVDVVALPFNNLPGSLCVWLRGFLKQVDVL